MSDPKTDPKPAGDVSPEELNLQKNAFLSQYREIQHHIRIKQKRAHRGQPDEERSAKDAEDNDV